MSIYDHTKEIFLPILLLLTSLQVVHAEDRPAAADNLQKASPQTQAKTSFYYFKDSDKSKIFRWGNFFEQALNDTTFLHYGYTRSVMKENGMMEIYENQHSFSARYEDDKKTAAALYKYRDFSEVEEEHNYVLEYSSPLLFIDSISFRHSYENEEKTKAIKEGIKKFNQSLFVYQDLFSNAYGTGMYSYDDYNDGNRRNTVGLGLFGRILQDPQIAVGYEFNYDYSDFDSPYYWTPRLQRLHQARLIAKGSIFGSKLSYDMSAAMGYVEEKGEDNQVANSAAVSFDYSLTESASIFFSYERYLTTNYRSKAAQGGIRIKF